MQNSEIHFKMYITEYQNVKPVKRPPSFRFEIGIFDIFLERLYEKSFEDLEVNSN